MRLSAMCDGDPFVCRVQQELKDKGYDPGPVDGRMGPMTRRAVRAFQSDHGLSVDGVVGTNTTGELFGGKRAAVIAPGMPWYAEAQQLIGTREVRGPGNNPVILDWADDLDIYYTGDDVPWCGLFVAHCIATTLPDEPLPGNVLGARQWRSFGREVAPRQGAVLVFWRGSPSGWKGHVGFYAAEDGNAYHVLGGNQSNAVNIVRIAKSRLLGAYWPVTAAGIDSDRELVASDGSALSEDEA